MNDFKYSSIYSINCHVSINNQHENYFLNYLITNKLNSLKKIIKYEIEKGDYNNKFSKKWKVKCLNKKIRELKL